MKATLQVTLVAAVLAVVAVIAVTVAVGARLREEPIVGNPYEEGLRYDADRHARAALGWDVLLAEAPSAPGPATLAFEVKDRGGARVEGAAVAVRVGRPETSRDVGISAAREAGGGRYAADVVFPAPGPWLVRFDVRRDGRAVAVEKVVTVAAACDLGVGPCTRALPDGTEVTLELGPRPLRTMRDLAVSVAVRQGASPVDGAAVDVRLEMKGMDMGPNARALAPGGGGRYAGTAVLVRCPSGRKDWSAEVSVARAGAAPQRARFELTVTE
ncbi:MAG TPA: FixH family protein [Anaeromyxobacter sp.]|nr:FixH family protein [Anaeromyxobacter sp.]